MRKMFNLIDQVRIYSDAGDYKAVNNCKTELTKRLLSYLEANFYEIGVNSRQKLTFILSLLPNKLNELIQEYRYAASSARKIVLLKVLSYLPDLSAFKRALIPYLRDEDSYVRATAVKLISNVATESDSHYIMELLNDSDGRVVSNTLEALNALDMPIGRMVYFRFKNNRHNRIKATSLKLLWDNGYKDVFGSIKNMIVSDDERMVASAFWLLSGVDFPMQSILKIAEKFSGSESKLIRISAIKSIIKRDRNLLGTFIKDNFIADEIIQAVGEMKKTN